MTQIVTLDTAGGGVAVGAGGGAAAVAEGASVGKATGTIVAAGEAEAVEGRAEAGELLLVVCELEGARVGFDEVVIVRKPELAEE